MRSNRGFTFFEIALVIVIVGILAAAAIPIVVNVRMSALRSAETGVVNAIRSGIQNYRGKSQLLGRTPVYPATLDGAAAGAAERANPFFLNVLTEPVVSRWSKQGLAYTGPTGTVYNYYPDTGLFVPDTLTSGYITAWNLNEGSGSTINLGPYQGTIVGNATWAEGKVGQALQFDGNGSYVHVPNSPALNPTTSGTVQAWVYADALKPFAGFVHKGDLANFSDEAYTLQTWSGDSMILGLNDAAGNFYSVQSSMAMQPGQWYHIAGTWDSGGMKIFINGQLRGSNTQAVNVRTSTGGLNIGAQTVQNYNAGWQNLPTQGRIDEVAIYDRALTAGEIASYYNTTVH